ncbi:hypothetical protein KW805_01205 [Candidatus Pacearchaeota archaeon]|nr:hypothetical protein [Candidatus Pacearchaeota archaeon]
MTILGMKRIRLSKPHPSVQALNTSERRRNVNIPLYKIPIILPISKPFPHPKYIDNNIGKNSAKSNRIIERAPLKLDILLNEDGLNIWLDPTIIT